MGQLVMRSILSYYPFHMPRLESAPRSLPERGGLRHKRRRLASAEKKREPQSALVKNKEGEVIGLRTDEQLVTKAEAYRSGRAVKSRQR